MESRENSIFGRKTFFLNPTMQTERTIVPRLRNLEYEVYIVHNYKDIKSVLRENPDSLCFINIDDQLNFTQWFNFIKSFEVDDSLKSIFLGVISSKAKLPDKEQFLMKTKLPGGFIDSSDNIDLLQDNLIKILDLNGAKGRRQYVRIERKIFGEASATCFIKEKLFTFNLLDISAAGFAAATTEDKLPVFTKGLAIGNIGLKLGQRTIYADAEVFAASIRGNACVVVFLFNPFTLPKVLTDIRNFIHTSLQNSVDSFIKSSIQDLTDYSEEIVPSVKESQQSIDDLKFEEMGDLEDLDISMDL